MALYKEYSTVKERYLHFQIKWLQHCSYFLVTYNSTLSDLYLLPRNPAADQVVTVVTTRSLLHQLWPKHKVNKINAKSFLILLCSSVFNELLTKCHSVIQPKNEIGGVDRMKMSTIGLEVLP